MGLNITCDCCQKQTQDVTEVGYVGKAYYCSECLTFYEDYKTQVDNFHDDIAGQVKEGLELIKASWLSQHPEATLPE